MSPRSLRRAAERRQAKLARKLERTALDQTNQDQITPEPVVVRNVRTKNPHLNSAQLQWI